MIDFKTWQKLTESLKEDNTTKVDKFESLISLHRITYNGKFREEEITQADREFLVGMFDTLKYLKQKVNVFSAKYKAIHFSIAYFGKSQWACSITSKDGREVTKKFQITEGKVNPMIDIIKKALDVQTFKNILPVERVK